MYCKCRNNENNQRNGANKQVIGNNFLLNFIMTMGKINEAEYQQIIEDTANSLLKDFYNGYGKEQQYFGKQTAIGK